MFCLLCQTHIILTTFCCVLGNLVLKRDAKIHVTTPVYRKRSPHRVIRLTNPRCSFLLNSVARCRKKFNKIGKFRACSDNSNPQRRLFLEFELFWLVRKKVFMCQTHVCTHIFKWLLATSCFSLLIGQES